MKKSTLLSLATAGAIVATSAFTFASWDQLDNTAQVATVTIRNPVTVTVTEDTTTELSTNSAINEVPTYTGTATVSLENATDLANYELVATPKVFDGAKEITSGLTATAEVGDATLADGQKTINVTVTPTDDSTGKSLAGQELTVKVTAKLQEKVN